MRIMAAGKFKAQCLAVLDEVETKRECVTVTKNGRPVAKMVPLELEENPLATFILFKILKIYQININKSFQKSEF